VMLLMNAIDFFNLLHYHPIEQEYDLFFVKIIINDYSHFNGFVFCDRPKNILLCFSFIIGVKSNPNTFMNIPVRLRRNAHDSQYFPVSKIIKQNEGFISRGRSYE
jgi:hypothetical protein